MTTTRSLALVWLAWLVCALAAVGCGGSGNSGSPSPGPGQAGDDASSQTGVDGGPTGPTGDASSSDGSSSSKDGASAGDGAVTGPTGPSDEFIGPFSSWLDLKKDFHAVGDGVTDDTAAVQAALTAVGTTGAYASPALYVPAGTYLVTQTVTLADGIYLSLVGEDPAKSSFKWGGASGGILFALDGVAYSRIIRLTFDGAGSALSAFEDSTSSTVAPGHQAYFSTGNEFSDDVFQNAQFGIRAGISGTGVAESTVLRCQFLKNSNTGLMIETANVLDWWVWYSTFLDNGTGVANSQGAYHVYDSLFERSANGDLYVFNTGLFNFRNNTSIDSSALLNETFYYTNAAPTIVEGNTVVNPTNSKQYALWQGNMGALFLADNVFASPPSDTQCGEATPPPNNTDQGCVIEQGGSYGADTFSLGNTYTVMDPVNSGYDPQPPAVSRFLSSGDKIVARSSLDGLMAPTMPGTLPNLNRTIFEVTGTTDVDIQAAIGKARASCGTKPVVHIPFGNYTINNPVTIPAGCDLQLVGDGGATRLQWAGTGAGPVLDFKGPSQATVRELYVNGNNGTATDILIENADQPGSRVYMLEATLNRDTVANLFVDGLDYTYVESQDIEHAYTITAPATTGTSVKVVGGPQAAAGKPQGGKTVLFAGSSGANYISYGLSNGGSLMVQDTWYEGNNQSTYAVVSDDSTFTLEGSRVALPQGNGDAIDFTNFNGTATLINNAFSAVTRIQGSGTGSVWMAGNTTDFNVSGATPYLVNESSTTTGIYTENRWQDPAGQGSLASPDQGTPTDAFIQQSLAQDRASRFAPISDLPAGVTDVKLYRVSTEVGTYGIHITK
jgi:hypothetical protein